MDSESRRGQKGFTLIELIIVLSIILIIVGMGMYTYVSQARLIRVRGDVREVYETLELAKMRAISTGVQHGVAFLRPNKYFAFSDCVNNSYFNDSDDDPTNNQPPANWDMCTSAAIGYDPLVEGQGIKELSANSTFDTIFGWSTPLDAPGSLESVTFNTLGQALENSSTFISELPIVILSDDPRGNEDFEAKVEVMGTSGVIDILPVGSR